MDSASSWRRSAESAPPRRFSAPSKTWCQIHPEEWERVHRRYLAGMAKGEIIFGFALNEAVALDLAAVPWPRSRKAKPTY